MSVTTHSSSTVESLDDTLTQSEGDRQRTAELSRADKLPPGTAPGFDLIRPLGEGAYGSVWLAKERKTGRFAAVKFFLKNGYDWVLLGREVEKLAALDTSHHIVGLIDVGWDAKPPFYVMEHLPNGSLASYLAAGPIPAAEAVELAAGVLRGLVHAHGGGILHCDLKPANVLLDQDFQPRLCDFGQARLTDETHAALGTLFYMAPEQADLKALPDVRWDVYALGALLYHMLTGGPPHRTPAAEQDIADSEATAARLATYRRLIFRSGAPTDLRGRPGVDKRLAEIVERCLAPEPNDRYRNAQAVLDAFESRNRQRSRRPLVALGLIGPVLLLAAMTPFFLTTMRNAESAAKASIVGRALESDAMSARLLARGLERELEERTAELERIARDIKLRELVERAEASAWSDEDRETLGRALRAFKLEAVKRDTSWFLQDDRGLQRWRDPYAPHTHDKDFRWRDYFHGRGVEYPEDQIPDDITPIRSSYISTVFRSDATGQYMVSITTPIMSLDEERVIGVLGRTQHLWELLDDYESRSRTESAEDGGIERVIALIDGRDKKLVAHQWMTEENVKGLSDEQAAWLRLSADQEKRLAAALAAPLVETGEAALLNQYRDPVATSGFAPTEYGGRWLAAVRPVAGTKWLAIVQERYEAAIAPAERMQSDLLLYGLAALGVGGGLIVIFWYFVTQALTDRTVTSHRIRDPDTAE